MDYKKKYTIKDIARLSGYSKSTVSSVLRNEPIVKESTKAKIKKVMKKIGYRPDEIARYLVTGRNINHIGLITSDIKNPYFAEIATEVESEAKKRNYNVILCNVNTVEEEKKHIDILLSNRTPGMILLTPSIDDENIKNLSEIDYPYVLINSKVKDIDSDIVSIDHYDSAIKATNYLIKMGHRRIAHFAGIKPAHSILGRIEGYKEALQKSKLSIDETIIFKDELTFDGGCRSAEKVFNMDNKPTAIFAANDIVAIAAMQYFKSKKMKIPEDISIIGFDNITMSSFDGIDLTTIDSSKFKLGEKSIEILLGRIENGFKTPKKLEIFKTSIIERGSVKEV